ncbi:MAG: hypothetical protein JWQ48_2439 [Conexibacter sp.]|nr:hypothetical protein [Conexibacter sp.]
MARQIALLRGINVGGHKKVPMARLRELLGELGYGDVRTYVQSGNVVLTGPDQPPEEFERTLERQLEEGFGFAVSVLVRSREQLAAVVAANPLGEVATEPARHHVLFLSGEPAAERLDAIDAAAFAPDAFVHRGREIYLWTPDGVRDSRLAKALSDARLGVTATARNWRTVEQLLALADETG